MMSRVRSSIAALSAPLHSHLRSCCSNRGFRRPALRHSCQPVCQVPLRWHLSKRDLQPFLLHHLPQKVQPCPDEKLTESFCMHIVRTIHDALQPSDHSSRIYGQCKTPVAPSDCQVDTLDHGIKLRQVDVRDVRLAAQPRNILHCIAVHFQHDPQCHAARVGP